MTNPGSCDAGYSTRPSRGVRAQAVVKRRRVGLAHGATVSNVRPSAANSRANLHATACIQPLMTAPADDHASLARSLAVTRIRLADGVDATLSRSVHGVQRQPSTGGRSL